MKELIQVEQLFKAYGNGAKRVEVLKGLDLTFFQGERAAIVGASGVGKTTLLHTLGTLDRPTSGKVLYEGKDIYALNERDLALFRNREIGFVFQFHHLLPEFSAMENTMMPCLIQGIPRRSRLLGRKGFSLWWVSKSAFLINQGSFPVENNNAWQWRGL